MEKTKQVAAAPQPSTVISVLLSIYILTKSHRPKTFLFTKPRLKWTNGNSLFVFQWSKKKAIYAIMTTSPSAHLLSTVQEIIGFTLFVYHCTKKFYLFKIIELVINFYLNKFSKLYKMFYHWS